VNGLIVLQPLARTATLIIFVLTYLGIAAGHVPGLKLDRTGIALLGAIAIMIFSGSSTTEIVGFVNWPTILLLFGFFVISAQLRLSGFFDRVASATSARLDHPARFLLLLMVVTAGLSAFLNHDIVCFVFTPLVATGLIRRQLNPVPFLIAVAIASNIGSAATFVGNPQGIMIAQIAKLSFGRYVLWCITPVMFALFSSYGIIWILSRKSLTYDGSATVKDQAAAQSYNRSHTIKGLIILGLVIAFFFTNVPKEVIALTAAGIHLASPLFGTEDLLGLVDWSILVLFMALFVVTGAFQTTGYGVQAVQWLGNAGLNLQSLPTLAVVTAALSNLINNSAAVMLLIKLTNIANPYVAYVMALGNSFGGSLIILGSVSNIIVVQQAGELGIDISFRDFARLGVPVTLVAIGGLLAWLALVP
jgi:Na+/H+ antiporter NhaD/arsenite permease-like protein